MIMSYSPGLANMPWRRWSGRSAWTLNLPTTHYNDIRELCDEVPDALCLSIRGVLERHASSYALTHISMGASKISFLRAKSLLLPHDEHHLTALTLCLNVTIAGEKTTQLQGSPRKQDGRLTYPLCLEVGAAETVHMLYTWSVTVTFLSLIHI